MLLPSRSKGLIEVVEIAIQGYNVHGRALEKDWFGNHRVDHFALSCKGPRLHRTDVSTSTFRFCAKRAENKLGNENNLGNAAVGHLRDDDEFPEFEASGDDILAE